MATEDKTGMVGNLDTAGRYIKETRNKLEKLWKEGVVRMRTSEIDRILELVRVLEADIQPIMDVLKEFDSIALKEKEEKE